MSETRSVAPASRPSSGAEVALRPMVHAALVAEDLVLLDIAADAYFCLRGDPAFALALSQDGRRLLGPENVCADLVAAGLAEPAGRGAFPPNLPMRSAPRPRRSALQDAHATPRWRDAPEALRTLVTVARAYRGRPFAEVIVTAPRVSPAAAPLLEIVARFHRWAPYAPTSAKCLLRSFMLRTILRRAGHDPLWVFGVQTWPFRAHCWLQVDDMVLDDTSDRVAGYVPILVV